MSGHSSRLAPGTSPDPSLTADEPQAGLLPEPAHPRDAGMPDDTRRRAYSQARRHSGWVRLFKVAIPVGAVLAGGLVVAVTWFNPFGKAGLTLGPVSLAGSKIAMESPRLTGFRKDAKPYEVTATAAFQDVRRPNVIEMKDMRAKLATDDAGAFAHLVSNLGLFDTSKDQLELKDDIRITTDKGDEVLLRTASVDFKAGTVVSKDPVRITTATGTVEAEGVSVSDNGHTFSFTGRVRTEFRRDIAEASPKRADVAPAAAEAAPVVASVPAAISVAAPVAATAGPGGRVAAAPKASGVAPTPPRRIREAEVARR